MPLLNLPEPTGARRWPFMVLTGAITLATLAFLGERTYRYLSSQPPRPAWTAETAPVAVSLGEVHLAVPANMIRFARQRRGGPQPRLDLALTWPALEGYSRERAALFESGAVEGPVIYVSLESASAEKPDGDAPKGEAEIAEGTASGQGGILDTPLQPDVRPGPAGLSSRLFAADTPFAGQEIVYGLDTEASDRDPAGGGDLDAMFAARCRVPSMAAGEASCIRRLALSPGLTLTYRFDRAYLGEWRRLDPAIRTRMEEFVTPERTGAKKPG